MVPITEGDTLSFYLDTGGINALYPSGVRKIGKASRRRDAWDRTKLGSLFSTHDIPLPLVRDLHFVKDGQPTTDGMLGRGWFAGLCWQFDHRDGTLEVGNTLKDPPVDSIPIFFTVDVHGAPTHHLPRVDVVIDGDTLSLLLDTGAQASTEGGSVIATSFITDSVFTVWQARHPHWVVNDRADRSFRPWADMIVVPTMRIGGQEVGPVTFTVREKRNFEVLSTHFMDKPVVGALGGNALGLLERFSLDYPRAKMYMMR
jgi:hypothetical protein